MFVEIPAAATNNVAIDDTRLALLEAKSQ